MSTILIADDEANIRNFLARVVEGMGHQIVIAENGKDAFDQYLQNDIDISIVDVNMPQVDGIQYLEKVKEKDPNAVVIVMTGYPSAETIIETIEDDGYTYITKPLEVDRIKDIVVHALNFRAQRLSQT